MVEFGLGLDAQAVDTRRGSLVQAPSAVAGRGSKTRLPGPNFALAGSRDGIPKSPGLGHKTALFQVDTAEDRPFQRPVNPPQWHAKNPKVVHLRLLQSSVEGRRN